MMLVIKELKCSYSPPLRLGRQYIWEESKYFDFISSEREHYFNEINLQCLRQERGEKEKI